MLLRAEYRVGPELKFLANLDMMHLMERAFRRASIPYALTEGFNPHIRLSMGTVLPVGLWGEKEYFDLELAKSMDLREYIQRMNESLPHYICIRKCQAIDAATPSIMKQVNAASYVFVLDAAHLALQDWKDDLLNRESIIVSSRGKKKGLDKDLRPGIYKVEIDDTHKHVLIGFWVSVGEPVNVRYDELEELLIRSGIEKASIIDVFRSGNYVMRGRNFFSPLEKVR
ncbi:MAG: TIGR03936 family radical SAM-associated protein [Syntrophomonas sp.]